MHTMYALRPYQIFIEKLNLLCSLYHCLLYIIIFFFQRIIRKNGVAGNKHKLKLYIVQKGCVYHDVFVVLRSKLFPRRCSRTAEYGRKKQFFFFSMPIEVFKYIIVRYRLILSICQNSHSLSFQKEFGRLPVTSIIHLLVSNQHFRMYHEFFLPIKSKHNSVNNLDR